MRGSSIRTANIPWQQQALRDKCFHPTGTFVQFRREEIEQSMPDRFEDQVRRYPDRLAVKAGNHQLTYNCPGAIAVNV